MTMKTMMANSVDFGQRYWREIGLLVLLALVVVLAAHAVWPRSSTSDAGPTTTGSTSTANWSRVCVGGVSYLQFTTGATVEWTPAGRVKTCSTAAK
jgi:hypothetical protein